MQGLLSLVIWIWNSMLLLRSEDLMSILFLLRYVWLLLVMLIWWMGMLILIKKLNLLLLNNHFCYFVFAFYTLAQRATKNTVLMAYTVFLLAMWVLAVATFDMGIIVDNREESVFDSFLLLLNSFLSFFFVFWFVMAFFAFTLRWTEYSSCKAITISLETFAVSTVARFHIVSTLLLSRGLFPFRLFYFHGFLHSSSNFSLRLSLLSIVCCVLTSTNTFFFHINLIVILFVIFIIFSIFFVTCFFLFFKIFI